MVSDLYAPVIGGLEMHVRLLAHALAQRGHEVTVATLAHPGSPAHKKATLGLDLQGGLEVVLRAEPPRGTAKLPAGALDRSVTVIRNRIDKLGVAEPLVTKQGSNEIVVELAVGSMAV